MKKFLRLLAGSVLFPVFIIVYLWDRVLTLPLVWIQVDGMMNWFRDTNKMTNSVIRGGVAGLIVFLIWLFV